MSVLGELEDPVVVVDIFVDIRFSFAEAATTNKTSNGINRNRYLQATHAAPPQPAVVMAFMMHYWFYVRM